ncbi:MAG TPA: winged-helix domain-containing protein, partial [Bacteroidales bacterium]|nr:winged-helix domain-containing protein [Bacteroidales bacterium]
MKKLPGKTVERLSEYRRALLGSLTEHRSYIFSHELAALLHITAVQVRRDLMLIGYGSVMRKGYDIRELIKTIGDIIDDLNGLNVAVIGQGNLGRAVTGYFKGK